MYETAAGGGFSYCFALFSISLLGFFIPFGLRAAFSVADLLMFHGEVIPLLPRRTWRSILFLHLCIAGGHRFMVVVRMIERFATRRRFSQVACAAQLSPRS